MVRLELPPLRERREDVPLLVDHFVARLNRLKDRNVAGLSDAALARLMEHEFPGNVRELENILEHAFVLCRGGLIELHHLPPPLRMGGEISSVLPAGLTLAAMEKRLLQDALKRNQGNRAAAARELGVDASTLFRKIKALKLKG